MKRRAGIFLMAVAVLLTLLPPAGQPGRERLRYQGAGRAETLPARRNPAGSVDINHAGFGELLQLPGVGETIAQAILDEREAHGNFRYPEDLLAVRGIGAAKLETLLPWIHLE